MIASTTMRRTDYDEIAGTYDEAKERHRIPPDSHLAARLELARGPFRLLDVACGTGNYLAAQRRAFQDARIVWRGLDASEAMLAIARKKLEGVVLEHGRAEALPHETATFDYVSCNFAFHHFEDKPRALDEMKRVLVPGGALRIANVAPEHMPRWWVYQAFPEALPLDQRRFWPVELLVSELEARGFDVRTEIRVTDERMPANDGYREAVRRDLSSITILDDADFEAGLDRLRRMAESGESLRSTSAVLECAAIQQR